MRAIVSACADWKFMASIVLGTHLAEVRHEIRVALVRRAARSTQLCGLGHVLVGKQRHLRLTPPPEPAQLAAGLQRVRHTKLIEASVA